MRTSTSTYFNSLVNIVDARVNFVENLIVDVLLVVDVLCVVLSIIIINLLLVG